MAHVCPHTPRSPRAYNRRRPERTALHRVVREHFRTVLERAEFHESGYPAYVRKEFERYLACGDLSCGFSRLRCQSCDFERLVAFSCKGRLCPSCLNRRMEQTAIHLEQDLLPHAPYRQWTLTVPWAYRLRLASDKHLLARVTKTFVRTVFSFHRRRARRLGITRPTCGSVTFIHRFNTLLVLSPHLHSIIPDGVFHAGDDGRTSFTALPPPTDDEVKRLLVRCARRIEQCFLDTIDFSEPHDDDDDALSQTMKEAAQPKAQTQFFPTAPLERQLCAKHDGYSLHANVSVAADDRVGLARLLRYGARPPLAASRVTLNHQGQVVYTLRKVIGGRAEITFEPEAFIRRLASLIPPPWLNLTRFHGVFSANENGHHAVRELVPKRAALRALKQNKIPSELLTLDLPAEPLPPPLRIKWGDLLRRTFSDALLCQECGGNMRLIATIKEPDVIAKILRHLGLPAEPLPIAPARDPPQLDFDHLHDEDESTIRWDN